MEMSIKDINGSKRRRMPQIYSVSWKKGKKNLNEKEDKQKMPTH